MMTGPDMTRVRDEARPVARAPRPARHGLLPVLLARAAVLMLCAALGAGIGWVIISQ